jgi:hypothetical protein
VFGLTHCPRFITKIIIPYNRRSRCAWRLEQITLDRGPVGTNVWNSCIITMTWVIRYPAGRAWNVVPDAVRTSQPAELLTFLRVNRGEIPSLCTHGTSLKPCESASP